MDANTWIKTQQELKYFVYRKVKDMAAAEDIVQDVFLKVHSNLGQLKDTEKITHWIYQITRNAIIDHFRNRSKSIVFTELDWENEKQVLNDCVATCLMELLNTLPDKYKQALELTEIDNLSQIDLAKRLNISYSGAKSRVQRARQMLKEKMDERYLIKMDSYGNVIVCENRVPCNCSERLSEEYL
jgi:RNA polymerase sigma-70 factor (ECF subfamily)